MEVNDGSTEVDKSTATETVSVDRGGLLEPGDLPLGCSREFP
jgi:hypothetical protein